MYKLIILTNHHSLIVEFLLEEFTIPKESIDRKHLIAAKSVYYKKSKKNLVTPET